MNKLIIYIAIFYFLYVLLSITKTITGWKEIKKPLEDLWSVVGIMKPTQRLLATLFVGIILGFTMVFSPVLSLAAWLAKFPKQSEKGGQE